MCCCQGQWEACTLPYHTCSCKTIKQSMVKLYVFSAACNLINLVGEKACIDASLCPRPPPAFLTCSTKAVEYVHVGLGPSLLDCNMQVHPSMHEKIDVHTFSGSAHHAVTNLFQIPTSIRTIAMPGNE